MFIAGGRNLTPEKLINLANRDWPFDHVWPDVLVFLETGLLAVKREHCGVGRLEFYKFKDDVLLAFSIALLGMIEDRVVHSEARFALERYAFQILEWQPIHVHEFRLMRLAVGRQFFAADSPTPDSEDVDY